jgi:hypothetical protein
MSETSCHFKTKFMKIDITVILEYPTYLNVILLNIFLPKRAHTHTVSLSWCRLKHTLAKVTT